jgi:hypothetical protein
VSGLALASLVYSECDFIGDDGGWAAQANPFHQEILAAVSILPNMRADFLDVNLAFVWTVTPTLA